ncbi:MAG: AbrB/MazE/SpoVT family DNA-binding domain-containing protein [Theionarchaea archaeon]|nr:AbrB/MazE/SpoVT family DNA-binding domain-containing protein [Theionarchaea archaeon]MBU7020325.1 AbrB/MazE/SpoVT family DNA-binding domain-containing protein [Theionarchaea archaeon]MBU7034828.1 AbrB/MazE/SpoVT family DNA-binding domain-containing protein [Theionarchaea archaeon]MBU7040259.1 AbrB/MazE/SpoVT family DNA-binding domain-containing protein [Theionarchaea archaeon]
MAEYTVRVGVQGRITIPKEIRDKEDIDYRDIFKIHNMSGLLILQKVRKPDDKTIPLDRFLDHGF